MPKIETIASTHITHFKGTHRSMYCTEQSSRQISHSWENAMNDTGKCTAWGERWWQWAWECFTRQTIIHSLFTVIMCHLTFLNLLQFRNIALCWIGQLTLQTGWKCVICYHLRLTWDLASPERYALTSRCCFREPQTSLTLFTEVDKMHTKAIYHGRHKSVHRYKCFKRFEQKCSKMQRSTHLLFVSFLRIIWGNKIDWRDWRASLS